MIGLFVFVGKGKNSHESIIPQPTPTPSYQEVDDSIIATLAASANRKSVTMEIAGLAGRFTGIEYELNYETDKGPKGTLSGATPIKLETGADSFTRDIELGTCSTGGKCTYDTGVVNFQLFVKLHMPDGTVQVLRETFEQV